jgi:hypothetical protein
MAVADSVNSADTAKYCDNFAAGSVMRAIAGAAISGIFHSRLEFT